MVMTQQLTPRTTLGGMLLAVAVGAWLATPTLAGPPKDSPRPPEAPAPQYDKNDSSSLTLVMRSPGDAGFEDMSLDERVRLIEEKVSKLMAMLGDWLENIEFEMPEIAFEMPELPEGFSAPEIKRMIGAISTPPAASAEGFITHTYELPEGKLEAITKLMVRPDVPVLVSPGDGEITVHGTQAQHMIFQAFCDMISSGEREVEYDLPPGKLEALTELMIRDDVPIMVAPGEDSIEVHGTALEQTVFEAFVNMISSDKPPAGVGAAITGPRIIVSSPDKPLPVKTLEYEQRAKSQMAELEKLYEMLAKLQAKMGQHAQEYDELTLKAEEIEFKAEQVEEEAKAIDGEADDLEGEARIRAIHRFNELMLKARKLENEARILDAKADMIESLIDRLEDKANGIEDRIVKLEDE